MRNGALHVRRFGPELAVAAIAVFAAVFVAGRAFALGFPLDDAWIHMVYGDALAHHGSLEYNEGIAATGSTSPLWACVAALAHLLTGLHAPSASAAIALKLLGVAFHAVAAIVAARLARALVPRRSAALTALGAGALVAVVPPMAYGAVSGMEVTLASALLLAAVLCAVRGSAMLAGLACGLAAVTRPEAIVVVPWVAVIAGLGHGRRVARVASTLATAALLPAALLVRNQLVSGRPLPATFYAKAEVSRPLTEALASGFGETLGSLRPTSWLVFWILVAGAVVLGALSAVRAARERRVTAATRPGIRIALIALAAIAYAVGASVVMRMKLPGAFYYQRYLLPCVPLLIVSATVTMTRLLGGRERARRHPAIVIGVGVFVVALAFVLETADLPRQRDVYATDVANTNEVQVTIGRFVADALPQGAVVWSVDAGAVRYFGRGKVVDLMGLNTPELIVHGKVKSAWWPDSVVVVPSIFAATGQPPLDVVFDAHAKSDAQSGERSVLAQRVFRCSAGAGDSGLDNKVGVAAFGRFIAVGRCARTDTSP